LKTGRVKTLWRLQYESPVYDWEQDIDVKGMNQIINSELYFQK
jgi:hypothetical protein